MCRSRSGLPEGLERPKPSARRTPAAPGHRRAQVRAV